MPLPLRQHPNGLSFRIARLVPYEGMTTYAQNVQTLLQAMRHNVP